MKQKRILSFILVFAMMIGLMATMPTKVYADDYDLWVGVVHVTDANADDISGTNITDGKVSYDRATKTLKLEDAKIKGVETSAHGDVVGIYSREDLTIKLIGDNVITTINTEDASSYGIHVKDNLKIIGDGTLTVSSNDAIQDSIGIKAENNLVIEKGTVITKGKVTALGYTNLDLSKYSNPIVKAGKKYDGLDKNKIDAPYPDFANSEYKYIEIRPEGTSPTPGGNNTLGGTYLPTGNMNWNLFGPPVVSEPAQDIIIKENVISFTVGENEYVLNRTKIAMDGTPYIKSDRIMLPVRYVAEAMGMKVEYDNDARVATFKDDKRTITINIDTGIMTLDGKEYPLEVKPEITNDRIYLPLGLIADALGMTRDNPQSGYDISWYQNTKTATITIAK